MDRNILKQQIKDRHVKLVLKLEVDVELRYTEEDGPSDAFLDEVDKIMSTYNVPLTMAVERVIGNAFHDRNSGNVKCFEMWKFYMLGLAELGCEINKKNTYEEVELISY